MQTSEFDFTLPQERIAQEPNDRKEQTKMLVSDGKNILDKQLCHIIDFLQEGDLLVFNDAKVIKAKLKAKILRNDAILEFNLDQESDGVWNALCKPAKKVKKDDILEISADFSAKVVEKLDDGTIKIEFNCKNDEFLQKLEKYGSIPLPPYIKREDERVEDQINYQTIYAKNGMAVAAPTAGLHFNKKMFDLLEEKGIKKAFVTLNVGAGTFLPVRSENIKDHKMHFEYFSISKETANMINDTKKSGGRIIAVGTTSMRVLESIADENGSVKEANMSTNIFIYPGYKFKIVDILMTNFHLPKSTLFMLICAFVGKEKAFEIYDFAVKNQYRFYSYGDSSLLFRKKDIVSS